MADDGNKKKLNRRQFGIRTMLGLTAAAATATGVGVHLAQRGDRNKTPGLTVLPPDENDPTLQILPESEYKVTRIDVTKDRYRVWVKGQQKPYDYKMEGDDYRIVTHAGNGKLSVNLTDATPKSFALEVHEHFKEQKDAVVDVKIPSPHFFDKLKKLHLQGYDGNTKDSHALIRLRSDGIAIPMLKNRIRTAALKELDKIGGQDIADFHVDESGALVKGDADPNQDSAALFDKKGQMKPIVTLSMDGYELGLGHTPVELESRGNKININQEYKDVLTGLLAERQREQAGPGASDGDQSRDWQQKTRENKDSPSLPDR